MNSIYQKYTILFILITFVVGGYFYFSKGAGHISQKCPDDYADTDAGSREYLAAMDKWTNDFYDSHPGVGLSDWSAARYQFWVDNNCAAALQRYNEVKSATQ